MTRGRWIFWKRWQMCVKANEATGVGALVWVFLTLCSLTTIAVACAMILLTLRVQALEQAAPVTSSSLKCRLRF